MLKKNNILKILNWLLVIGWMGLIFYLSSIPSFPLDLSVAEYNWVSSIAHVLLYAVLTWLLIRAFMASGLSLAKSFAFGFLLSIIYGATDEIHQLFVPGREAHISDWLLDLAGSYMILSFYTYKYGKYGKRK